jgi:hypothetical protein
VVWGLKREYGVSNLLPQEIGLVMVIGVPFGKLITPTSGGNGLQHILLSLEPIGR